MKRCSPYFFERIWNSNHLWESIDVSIDTITNPTYRIYQSCNPSQNATYLLKLYNVQLALYLQYCSISSIARSTVDTCPCLTILPHSALICHGRVCRTYRGRVIPRTFTDISWWSDLIPPHWPVMTEWPHEPSLTCHGRVSAQLLTDMSWWSDLITPHWPVMIECPHDPSLTCHDRVTSPPLTVLPW